MGDKKRMFGNRAVEVLIRTLFRLPAKSCGGILFVGNFNVYVIKKIC
jgi:hypothetical protein